MGSQRSPCNRDSRDRRSSRATHKIHELRRKPARAERGSVSGCRVRGRGLFVGARGRAVQRSAKDDGHENGNHTRDDPGVAVHEALVFGVRSGLGHRGSSHTSLRLPSQPSTSAGTQERVGAGARAPGAKGQAPIAERALVRPKEAHEHGPASRMTSSNVATHTRPRFGFHHVRFRTPLRCRRSEVPLHVP
jgi:hypothetical protein